MNKAEKSSASSLLPMSLLRGVVVWLAAAAALLLVGSLICYSLPDPDKYLGTAAVAALYASVAAGGFASAKKSGKALSGALTGLVALVILLIASAFAEGESSYGTVLTTVMYVLVPLTGFVGSFLALLLSGRGKSRKPSAKRRTRKSQKRL